MTVQDLCDSSGPLRWFRLSVMVPEGPEPASTICLVLMPNLVPYGTGSYVSEQRLGQKYTTAEETGTIYEEVVHFQWGASDKNTGVQDLQ